jgi:hypothetical protein
VREKFDGSEAAAQRQPIALEIPLQGFDFLVRIFQALLIEKLRAHQQHEGLSEKTEAVAKSDARLAQVLAVRIGSHLRQFLELLLTITLLEEDRCQGADGRHRQLRCPVSTARLLVPSSVTAVALPSWLAVPRVPSTLRILSPFLHNLECL